MRKEVDDNTEATVDHVDANRANLYLSAYKDYTKAGCDLSKDLTSLISDDVDYRDHETGFYRVQSKLDSVT